jgi:hypothetical protein
MKEQAEIKACAECIECIKQLKEALEKMQTNYAYGRPILEDVEEEA